MPVIDFADDEANVIRELIETAYRRQHREHWEISKTADPGAEPSLEDESRKRLRILEAALRKFGSDGETALRHEPRIIA